ncbi:cyclic nucleotide-binding domain-containing protein [Desulfosediminicola flagellatus]|uniref:cyclic nucleotide-binding domain-containing protein n=1 Tax=Desulfosediminicola flagellatus TaxID=2569541 RepID=UPI0010ACE8D0|nr:cyclic nucleotide-binding domain-containing protein [Desulfosediminicola flagellatus]
MGNESLQATYQNTNALLDMVVPFSNPCSFATGEQIMSHDDDPMAFYYVVDGVVEVSYTEKAGTRITVALIGKGDFFGEVGFFDGETRVRDIKANGDVKVGIFNASALHSMRTESPDLFMDFMLFITRNICHKFRRIAGERQPVTSYAKSLSIKNTSTYTESSPLPATLLHSGEWHSISSRMEMCRAELFDISHQLQKNEATGNQDSKIEVRCTKLLTELNSSLSDFQQTMAGTGYEEIMWGYVFKEIFPYFMRSKFAERAYFKPKGYAGDFLMMEHIYANVPKGEGRLGEIIDDFCLQRPGSLAIHGRRKLLKKEIARISGKKAELGENTRIMNLACGPNRELFDFLGECKYSQMIDALCVDIDPEALQYTNQFVNIIPHKAAIRLMSENVIRWSLGKASQQIGNLDLIYSAGLCDYLDERLFKALITRCFEHLNPGGTLLLGNFTQYPDSLFLDKLLKWELIYRNEEELQDIFSATPFGSNVEILSESEHVNLFALATKV